MGREIQVIKKQCFREYSGGEFSFEEGSVLESIEDEAFYAAKFRSIAIPSTVVKIGKDCFRNCELSRITFEPGSRLNVFPEGMFLYDDRV